jgi:hypothetical protein
MSHRPTPRRNANAAKGVRAVNTADVVSHLLAKKPA